MTNLQRHMTREQQEALGWYDEEGNLVMHFKSPAQGAATSAWAAHAPELNGLGGVYCEDCDIARQAQADSTERSGVMPWATDPERAERLWRVSELLTGVAFDA